MKSSLGSYIAFSVLLISRLGFADPVDPRFEKIHSALQSLSKTAALPPDAHVDTLERSIRDFFRPESIGKLANTYDWDSKTAYSACRLKDKLVGDSLIFDSESDTVTENQGGHKGALSQDLHRQKEHIIKTLLSTAFRPDMSRAPFASVETYQYTIDESGDSVKMAPLNENSEIPIPAANQTLRYKVCLNIPFVRYRCETMEIRSIDIDDSATALLVAPTDLARHPDPSPPSKSMTVNRLQRGLSVILMEHGQAPEFPYMVDNVSWQKVFRVYERSYGETSDPTTIQDYKDYVLPLDKRWRSRLCGLTHYYLEDKLGVTGDSRNSLVFSAGLELNLAKQIKDKIEIRDEARAYASKFSEARVKAGLPSLLSLEPDRTTSHSGIAN